MEITRGNRCRAQESQRPCNVGKILCHVRLCSAKYVGRRRCSPASNQWKTKPAEHRPQARVNIQVLHLQHQNVNFILNRFRFSTESYWRLTPPHYKLSGSENDAISLAAR